MIKFWDLNQGSLQEPSFVLYEHEEGILSADLHKSNDLMVSIDGDC